MALLIGSTTLILLIGYLIIDDIEYEAESILAHLGLQLFGRGSKVRTADDSSDDA